MSPELPLIAGASFFAGLVDSMVGGGGLILTPTLFSAYPDAAPATLFGTNKTASVAGTSLAAVHYTRRVKLQRHWLVPAIIAALIGSFAGAWSVTQLDATFMRRLLPLLLLGVLGYTLANRHLGLTHAPRHPPHAQAAAAATIGALIGWYDGFFGPGTGSFLIFAFVRVMGFDFLNASAAAKVLNVTTNVAALSLFAWSGHVWWSIGLTLAAANATGSLIGARLALRHGAQLVRTVFLCVVSALIVKTAYDAFVK